VIPRTYVPDRHTVFIAMFLGLIEAHKPRPLRGKNKGFNRRCAEARKHRPPSGER